MQHEYQALGFADAELSSGSHICCFYDSDNNRIEVVKDYISNGLLNNERCLVIAPEEFEFELKASLAMEISTTQALESGQLYFDRAEDLADLGLDGILNFFRSMVDNALSGKWSVARVMTDTGHLLRNVEDKTDWLRFEAKVNLEFRSAPAIFLCEYDLRTVSAQFMINILRTHPLVVVDGVFFENKFMIESTSYLSMLDKKQAPIN